MEKYNETMTVRYLQGECRRLGVSTCGKKSVLVERLLGHVVETAELNHSKDKEDDKAEDEVEDEVDDEVDDEAEDETEDEVDDEVEDDAEDDETGDEEVEGNEERRRLTYTKKDTFDNLEAAQSSLESYWVFSRKRPCLKDYKNWYSCKYSSCNKKTYIVYTQPKNKSVIWESDNDHEHVGEATRISSTGK